MPTAEPAARANQRLRTRKDLLNAAAALMKRGEKPTLDEVAREALVSRATAYRYFANVEALLVESSVDIAMPEPGTFFATMDTDEPVPRLTHLDAVVQAVVADNEPALRMMLVNSLQQRLKAGADAVPARQNRRTPLIAAALAPARRRFRPAALDLLSKSLALVVGTEPMLVFRDVLGVADAEAGRVKRWMIEALVAAALAPTGREAPPRPGAGNTKARATTTPRAPSTPRAKAGTRKASAQRTRSAATPRTRP